MKALVLTKSGGPQELVLQEVPEPQPGTDEVRVRLLASALNRRDYWITRGLYPGIRLPCITGSDGAGTIDKTGREVDPSLSGREVVIYPGRNWGNDQRAAGSDFRVLGMPDQGTFAEYICVPASDVCAKPVHLNWEQAAALPLGGLTSWRAVVTQAEINKGQRVLITGAGGGVAGFAMLWSLRLGAEVWVSTGNDAKLDWAKSMGASGGVNYHDANCYTGLSKRVGGFDAIIDSAGGDTVNQLLASLKPGGRYVFYGATNRNPSAGLEMARLFFRQIRIQGTTVGSPREFSAMLEFVTRHGVVPVIDRVLPLSEAPAGYRLLEDNAQTGKIVFRNRV